jgi:hypothetical protein
LTMGNHGYLIKNGMSACTSAWIFFSFTNHFGGEGVDSGSRRRAIRARSRGSIWA